MHDDGNADDECHDGGTVMVHGTGHLKGPYVNRDDGRLYGDGERRNYGHTDGQYYGHVDGHGTG